MVIETTLQACLEIKRVKNDRLIQVAKHFFKKWISAYKKAVIKAHTPTRVLLVDGFGQIFLGTF